MLAEPGLTRLRCDLSPAYDVEGLEIAERELRLTATSLRLRDRFAASRPLAIVDRLVSFFPIELDGEGTVIRGSRSGLRLTFAGTGWRATVHRMAYRGRTGEPVPVHVLDLSRTATEAELTVTMDLLPPLRTPPDDQKQPPRTGP
ncbi:hypothetical protein [Streptomyces sp. NPDC046631]|uniref:hypothetical protein n=1 Tax=unclassified Streptomyces TaxID=2593676 RepID=UPI0034093525